MKTNNKEQNIILMAPLPPPAGGIGSWTQRFLKIASQYNLNVFLCDESVTGKRKVFGKKSKKNFFTELKRSFNIWKSLKQGIKHFGGNCVIHCCIPAMKFSLMRELVSLKIAKKRKIPFIIHFRSTVPNSIQGKTEVKLLKKMLTGCSKCIVLNSVSKTFVQQFVFEEKIFVIPNFIENSSIVDSKKINENLVKAIYVGGVIPEKGCNDIFEIAKRIPEICFELIGAYDLDYVRNVETIPNLTFRGEVEKKLIDKYLDDADIFLFMSKFKGEGFSNAVVEAMSRGLPCVVTDWAANKDQVGEYAEQICIQVGDIDSAVSAIFMLKDKKIREDISKYNISRVKTHYSEEAVMKQYKHVYDELCEEL